MSKKYAILMETSGSENESWYFFLRYDGNEEALKALSEQFTKIEWYIIEDMSSFRIDIDSLVSEDTAREMCELKMNYTFPHRKFDGVLQTVNFNIKDTDRNERKIEKVFALLGNGKIDRYVTEEDLTEGKSPWNLSQCDPFEMNIADDSELPLSIKTICKKF